MVRWLILFFSLFFSGDLLDQPTNEEEEEDEMNSSHNLPSNTWISPSSLLTISHSFAIDDSFIT